MLNNDNYIVIGLVNNINSTKIERKGKRRNEAKR